MSGPSAGTRQVFIRRRLAPVLAALAALLLAALLLAWEPAGAQPTIPDDCQRWFDGCNTCARSPDGSVICTEKKCATMGPALCLRRSGQRRAIPKDCAVWFDGCNTCRRRSGRTVVCTRRYCSTFSESRCIRKTGEQP